MDDRFNLAFQYLHFVVFQRKKSLNPTICVELVKRKKKETIQTRLVGFETAVRVANPITASQGWSCGELRCFRSHHHSLLLLLCAFGGRTVRSIRALYRTSFSRVQDVRPNQLTSEREEEEERKRRKKNIDRNRIPAIGILAGRNLRHRTQHYWVRGHRHW